MVLTEDIKKFPSTRYQGSKRKILSWLYGYFNKLEFNSVLDAFGGTGSVSYMFKLMGKEVTFNDELTFNSIIGKALIENSSVKLSDDDIDLITNIEEIDHQNHFIENNFSEIYFTDEENIWIDKFLHNLNNLIPENNNELEYKQALAKFALYQASLTKRPYNLFHRKNLYMRLNDVERNFGNKTTWERSFKEQVSKFANEANNAVFEGNNVCRVLNSSAFDIIENDYDLVYLDPPYVDINGDHDTIDYLYCYHFLEGLSQYNNWEDYIDFETKNLRFKKDLYSTHFKKKNVAESFERLFEKYQNSIIALSYKKNGVPSIGEIEKLLHKFKPNVQVFDKHYIYALNRQNGNAKLNREVLLIGS